MLKLQNISKQYKVGTGKVDALKHVNLEFRENEFVSILGPSGSGKTTLLNIIGGLDRYTDGDLLINGKSTKEFNDADWDAYRNSTVGFVFQNYYLIPHISVLQNVEMSLTLSGISAMDRKRRAQEALASVGLTDQMGKKPNQLSGGQMQRVAIARALVNNPKIIFADEPTGALDSATSEQIMQLLKEISGNRLIIMVTHNKEVADQYSTRIIELLDGEVKRDSMPYISKTQYINPTGRKFRKKTGMPFFYALALSAKNLKTKAARTILTSVASSIGILGIALVLAISSGMTNYVNSMQSEMLASMPLTITPTVTLDSGFNLTDYLAPQKKFIRDPIIVPYDRAAESEVKKHTNDLSPEFLEYLNQMNPSLYNSVSYAYTMAVFAFTEKFDGTYGRIDLTKTRMQQLPPSDVFVNSLYDVLGGYYPQNSGEAVLIVDEKNRLDVEILMQLGIDYTYGENLAFADVIGKTVKVLTNNEVYEYNPEADIFKMKYGLDYKKYYTEETGKTVTITGIIRIKEDGGSGMLQRGIGYTPALTEELLEENSLSDIVVAQMEHPETNMLNGKPITEEYYKTLLAAIGGSKTPTAIIIYPKSFEAKDAIKGYLNEYNILRGKEKQVLFNDVAETVITATSTLINTITIILTAFAAISLVVSSLMIGIITYVSVVERTKEIGILRSIGARKKDISRIFNAETVIIGFAAGVIGVVSTFVLSVPMNAIIEKMVKVREIANLPYYYALALVAISMLLTLIAGLIPSRIAAKKDPVTALRTD